MNISLSEAFGWLGSILYVIAYLLLSMKKIKADSNLYQLMNIGGAIGLIINAIHWKDTPSTVVNFIWLCIGIIAIFMNSHGKRSRAGEAA